VVRYYKEKGSVDITKEEEFRDWEVFFCIFDKILSKICFSQLVWVYYCSMLSIAKLSDFFFLQKQNLAGARYFKSLTFSWFFLFLPIITNLKITHFSK